MGGLTPCQSGASNPRNWVGLPRGTLAYRGQKGARCPGLGSAPVPGSKRQLRQGVWELRLSLGRDPTTGKYKQLSRTFHGDAAGADEALRALAESEVRKIRDTGTDGVGEGPGDAAVVESASAGATSEERDEADAVRRLLDALPLDPGECVVGWSADRVTTPAGELEAAYDRADAAYQMVLLHRVRRWGTGASTSAEEGPRTVWLPREIVERAQPSSAHDCALHVWTL
jgi:hypothetical protein